MRTRHALLAALIVAVVESETQAQVVCRVCALGISTGMARTEVERKIAELRGTPSVYSSYGNSLNGGLVRSSESRCELSSGSGPLIRSVDEKWNMVSAEMRAA